MNAEQAMVAEFHRRFGVLIRPVPEVVDRDTQNLRLSLIWEELYELRDAMLTKDIVKIADALADLSYVVNGTAVTYGIDMEPVFAEVHRSNMSKGEPEVVRALDGKILKGSAWHPPNLWPILVAQGYAGNVEKLE